MEEPTTFKHGANKKRKSPNKMVTTIGTWKEIDGTDHFVVVGTCAAGEASLRKAVEGLAPGTYTAITGRERPVTITEQKQRLVKIG